MATLSAVANMPALGLLSEEGKLEHSSEPFRRWFAGKEDPVTGSPECRRVLSGQANAAVLKLDNVSVDIAAMVDTAGERHVLLTVPTDELPSLGDAGGALLDGALDESPALVWLKDLDGRYVRANPRFTSYLGTSEDRLLGRTDAELEPGETVDGPRAHERGDDEVEEPLQLEYFVGAFQGRDALVALRFPVGDRQGVPTLVCGVAAPTAEADVARSEAARLLRIERWSRLDAESVRAELLAEWGVLPDARGRTAAATQASDHGSHDREHQAAVAEARAERATAVAERDSALSANEKLSLELEVTRGRIAELERAVHSSGSVEQYDQARAALVARTEELERTLGDERKRAEELEHSLAQVRERLSADADAARVEVERARADVEAARTQLEQARTDAEIARGEIEKARAAADQAIAAAAAERDSASSTRAALEREVQQAREHLAELERAQDTGDWQAQVVRADKARAAAETALTQAIAERDETLKARAALAGELEQERVQVAALRKSSEAADDRVRELGGDLERERVRRIELEGSAARIQQQLEADVDAARAEAAEFKTATDKIRADLELARGNATELEAAAGKVRIELAQMRAEAEGARAEAERVGLRAGELEGQRERARAAATGLEAELEQARAHATGLAAQLDLARSEAPELAAAVEEARAEAAELKAIAERREGELEQARGEAERERLRADELDEQLEQARVRAEAAEASAADLQRQLEEAAAPADPVGDHQAEQQDVPSDEHAGSAAPGENPDDRAGPTNQPEMGAPVARATELTTPGTSLEAADPGERAAVSWQPTAKRALSASLARESVWRGVLKETVVVLGSEGGWDTVTAWLPDGANRLECAAMWSAHPSLGRFEALTSEVPIEREGSLLGQALQAPHLTWLTDIDVVDDERLQSAAAHGMRSALLLPVRDGATTIGLLELLTHASIEPDAQIALSLEASALQLGRFGHQLSLGARPLNTGPRGD